MTTSNTGDNEMMEFRNEFILDSIDSLIFRNEIAE
tara:strand:- start:1060 stop:1164 length:105 start_codon:yes stop_codon:yes gene_type:complete